MRNRTESLPKGGPTWGGKMHRNSVPGEAVSWGKNRKTIFRGTEILKGKILPLNSNTQNTRNHGGSGGCPPGGGPGAAPPVYGRHFWQTRLRFWVKKSPWKVRRKRPGGPGARNFGQPGIATISARNRQSFRPGIAIISVRNRQSFRPGIAIISVRERQ